MRTYRLRAVLGERCSAQKRAVFEKFEQLWYEKDYDDVKALKQLADKHNLAVLIIHHLRKTGDSDPVNMISGSSGISGSADGSYILQKVKRTET
ncbi:MAG: hypothetical protein SNH27_12120, partial [Rikenellaceae bacterium]